MEGGIIIYMATSFPTTKDDFVNPQSTDSTALVSHASQHANANDAIEALETKVGVNNSTDPNSLDYKVKQLELNFQDPGEIKDLAAASILGGTHTGITVSYNDTTNILSLTATYDDDEVVTAVAQALTAGNGISKTFNDTTNVITIQVDTSVIADRSYVDTSISNLIDAAPGVLNTLNEIAAAIGDDANFATTITTALATKLNITTAASTYLALANTTEVVQDLVAGMVSGNVYSTGVALTYDDPAGKLNLEITTKDLPGFTEAAQDSVASLFTHAGHSNVTATYDDVANKINLAVTAQLTQEQAQDYIAPLFTHGLNPNITATYDDDNQKLILETIIPPSKAIMSASAPSSPADGEFWFDTDEYRSGNTRSLKVWNALASSWEYVSTALSLSTTNTWTSKNTFTNGVIVGLEFPPPNPVHGQIYYNLPLDKLKVWTGLLWDDIQVGGGGGGLSLTPTDNTAAPSIFFVGLVAPPAGATQTGDLWIDVDDIDTPFNQFYTGAVSPDPAQYEFWVDNVEPIQELIYSADEPGTPSYEGELWIDTDEFDGSIVEFGATAPNPNNVQLWVDINENESPSYYDQLTFTNYATVANFPQNAPNGFVASDASTGLAYVRSQGQWLAIVTASNINNIISSNSTVFEDLKALAWMGFE
jgi:hypothetical protein